MELLVEYLIQLAVNNYQLTVFKIIKYKMPIGNIQIPIGILNVN